MSDVRHPVAMPRPPAFIAVAMGAAGASLQTEILIAITVGHIDLYVRLYRHSFAVVRKPLAHATTPTAGVGSQASHLIMGYECQ